MLWICLSNLVFAQDPITLDLVQYGQVSVNQPKLTILFHDSIPNVSGDLKCGSTTIVIPSKSGSRGSRMELDLSVPVGKHNCSGMLEATFEDGGTGTLPLKFQIQYFPELNLTIDRSTVDLEKKQLVAKIDRPVSQFQIQVLDVDGSLIGDGGRDVPLESNGSPQTVEWVQSEPDPAIIRIKAKDIFGFYTQTDLLPWHYEIPHEDVVFASNSSEIRSTEIHKLSDVRIEINKIVDRYAHIATVNLYIAGYTDTMGPNSSNMTLSQKRAKSIAQWFDANEFPGKIYYQGFGENVLAIPTADNVDEEKNRRALYVVAAEVPTTSTQLPSSNWTKLK